MTYVGLYAKAFIGAAVAALGSYSVALKDGPGVTAPEWLSVAGVFIVTFGAVFLVPNVPESVRKYGKAITGLLAALLGTLATAWLDGSVSQSEVINAIVFALTTTGLVGITSNAASSDPVVNRRLVPVTAAQKRDLVRTV